jgi:hypothetical protein
MAKQRSSFAKLQRDKAKKERAAMKRANRRDRRAEADTDIDVVQGDDVELVPGDGELSAPELLALIEDLHNRREAGTISLEDFEEAKVELFARLPVD